MNHVPAVRHTGVSWVQRHRFKALMPLQHSTRPFPNTPQVGLATELVALVSHRNWVPVLETHVGSLQVDEEVMWIRTRACARGAVGQRLGWRALINSVVDQVSGNNEH